MFRGRGVRFETCEWDICERGLDIRLGWYEIEGGWTVRRGYWYGFYYV